MQGIATIVFSKDRPLQLDAALRSLRLHTAIEDDLRTTVLYAASRPEFESAYGILSLQHPDVEFHRESDFKLDLLSVVGDAEYVFFMVDDTLVVGQLPLPEALDRLEKHEDLIGFSFRLGRNTIYSYAQDAAQALPEFIDLNGGVLGFEWGAGEHDFGYPLEVSSSLYRAKDIRPLLGWLPYRNPNTLEDALARSAHLFSTGRPRLACMARSVAVSVPVNTVQSEWSNRAGLEEGLGVAALLRRFEHGERVEVRRYDGVVPTACHQELGYILTRDEDIPAVSVILRCSEGRHLGTVIECLVDQPMDDWEVIVEGDSEADGLDVITAGLIETHPDRRIRYMPLSRPLPLGAGSAARSSLGRHVLVIAEDDADRLPGLRRMVDRLDEDPTFGFVLVPERPPLVRRHLWYCEGLIPALERASTSPDLASDSDLLLSAIDHGVGGLRLPGPLSMAMTKSPPMASKKSPPLDRS